MLQFEITETVQFISEEWTLVMPISVEFAMVCHTSFLRGVFPGFWTERWAIDLNFLLCTMYDKRRNKQFFFGLKRIQHRDSIFHQNFGSKLHRSRYFEARYLEIEKKDVGKKIVYFRTPVALYISKFIAKNKKKTFF